MAKAKFEIEGMKELEKSLKKLGDVPQKHVSSSAKKAMNIVKKKAKADAPEDTGDLKKGIILVGEKSKVKSKKVYRVVFDRAMNDVFQHKTKSNGYRYVTNAKGKEVKRKVKSGDVTGYYPVSQEYGYFSKSGRYIPGFAFTRNALEAEAPTVEKTIVSEMKKKIDQEITKGGLKK